MPSSPLSTIEFSLPPELEASAPPEARGLRRDQVRLMVSNYSTDQVRHDRFHHLDEYLSEGDVLVINTSRTRNSALAASRASGVRCRSKSTTQKPLLRPTTKGKKYRREKMLKFFLTKG